MLASDAEDSETLAPPEHTPRSSRQENMSPDEIIRLRQQALSASFSEIRSRSSPEENSCIIENITILQRDIRRHANAKRDNQSIHSESENPLSAKVDENLSPRKKNSLQKQLFSDASTYSSVSHSQASNSSRPPLTPLDMNSTECKSRWRKGTCKQNKFHARTLKMKAKKLEKQSPKK